MNLTENLIKEIERVEATYKDHPKVIKIWPYHLAPDELKAIYYSQDDMDWIVVIPPGFVEGSSSHDGELVYPYRLDSLGVCENYTYTLTDGTVLIFSCHS